MSRWTHLLCEHCYDDLEPGRLPVRVFEAPHEPSGEPTRKCCRCPALTRSGIYYRADPERFPCRGEGEVHS